MEGQRYGDSFKLKCWQLRDLVTKLSNKLWEDWNHNKFGFGDGPVGEFIPADNLDKAKLRAEIGMKFLKDPRFTKYLNSSQPVTHLFRYVKILISRNEVNVKSGVQVSLFETPDILEKRSKEQEKELEEDLSYLKEVRDMIKSPQSYFQNCYRA